MGYRAWFLLLILVAVRASNASAGWFGPSEKDVDATVKSLERCEPLKPSAFDPQHKCCRKVCVTLTNHADKTLTDAFLEISANAEGRSTEYQLGRNLRTDRVIEPKGSGDECFSGKFEYFGSALCADEIRIAVKVTAAHFR